MFLSIHKQLWFSMLPSILTFGFDLILGLFFGFLGPKWANFEVGLGSKTCLGSDCIATQLLFSILSLILTFNFDQIFGSVFGFWGPNVLFLGLGFLKDIFLGSSYHDWQLCFSMYWPIQAPNVFEHAHPHVPTEKWYIGVGPTHPTLAASPAR